MPHPPKALLLIVAAAFGALISAKPSLAEDGASATSSQQLFIDQRRLPEDAQKTVEPRSLDNADEQHKAEEQKKLDDLAAKLKSEEEALAAREADARKKFDELKRLSDEADVKRKDDEEQLRAREAEARRQVEEAKRLADEARSELKDELRKQSAQKNPPAAAASDASNPSITSSPSGQNPSAVGPETNTAPSCLDAILTASPLPGGRAKIAIRSPCRHAQPVSLHYGSIVIRGMFDGTGSADLIADMFLGPGAKTSVFFADGKQQHVDLPAGDVDSVTKIAVVWNAPVDLDLHAYEYAAVHGEPGDVWSGSPRTASIAAALVAKDGRGHGFMSSTDDGSRAGAKAEVFTFWQSKQQSRGVIAMALDYKTRGDEPRGDACGNGRYAQIPIQVVVRGTNGPVTSHDALIASALCGKTLSSDERYQTGVVPDLRIHQAN